MWRLNSITTYRGRNVYYYTAEYKISTVERCETSGLSGVGGALGPDRGEGTFYCRYTVLPSPGYNGLSFTYIISVSLGASWLSITVDLIAVY